MSNSTTPTTGSTHQTKIQASTEELSSLQWFSVSFPVKQTV